MFFRILKSLFCFWHFQLSFKLRKIQLSILFLLPGIPMGPRVLTMKAYILPLLQNSIISVIDRNYHGIFDGRYCS